MQNDQLNLTVILAEKNCKIIHYRFLIADCDRGFRTISGDTILGNVKKMQIINFWEKLSSIESQPKKVDVVVVFIDGLVFVVYVVLSVAVVIICRLV